MSRCAIQHIPTAMFVLSEAPHLVGDKKLGGEWSAVEREEDASTYAAPAGARTAHARLKLGNTWEVVTL